MAWGSPKQIAFFKKMAERYNVCSGGADVFDLEAYKLKHVRKLKALRQKKQSKKLKKKADAWAKRKGFKSYAEMEAKAAVEGPSVMGPGEHWKTRKKRLSTPARGHALRWNEKRRYEGPLNLGAAGREYYRG